MRRALTVILLLALMAGFGFGVNRLIASRKHQIPTEASVFIPTATRPKIVLPGTLYLAQNGDIYRLSDGFFTDLHLSTAAGSWMQPAYVPNSQDIVAVLRAAEYSNLYLLNSQGSIIRRLSNNANPHLDTVYLNHWMFYPHMGADGNTIFFSYDQPKNSATYAVDFSVWSGTLNGKLAATQLSNANPFTGGDVDPTPMANGAVMYSKFAIGSGNAFSQIAIQLRPLGRPIILTTPAEDCGQPAPSPDGTKVAMICIGGTGLQSTRLEVATLSAGKLGPPQTLVDNCLCSGPVWAPDGSGLVYYNAADATGHFELWWIKGALSASPSPPLQVTTNLDFDASSPPSWSPLSSVPVMPR
ncbi:MAG: TolB family protein [Candidatus Dormibacteria bacterium]